MRQSMLVIAVLSLTLFSSNALAQAPGNNKTRNDFDCTASAAQTLSADRLGNARKCYQQGLELMESGQLPQAVEKFRQALQFDPEYADAYAALGRTYFKLREWQMAVDNLNRAASLNSKQREANEAALKKTPVAEPQTLPKTPAANTNSTAKQTEATVPVSIKPKQQPQPAKVQDSVQPTNTSTRAASLPKNDPIPAGTVADASQVKASKEGAGQSVASPTPPASLPQNPTVQVNTSSDAAQVKAPKEEEEQSVGDPTLQANKDASVPEQTVVGARVSTNVTASSIEEASPTASTAHRPEELPLTKIYRVGPNDVLDVRLNDSGQQSTLYTVTPTGLLEHPLLNEPMSVAGLTIEEIGTQIEDDLRKRAIVEDPKAVVGIRDYASHAVLVSGLVRDAGTKFIRREAIPLYVVVADAQPLPEAAKVTVVRNESNQLYEIELNRAADMNFLVRSGDVITLTPNTTQFVYIGGEIKFPGEKTFRRGLTLMQVILAAGGMDTRAKFAEIARDDGKGFLVPTRFKLKEIVSGKAIDPPLKPGDRISILR